LDNPLDSRDLCIVHSYGTLSAPDDLDDPGGYENGKAVLQIEFAKQISRE
jgi:hypothetical protein